MRSVSSMRVCQPGPPARKWARTSGLSRIVVLTFGFSDLGRPRCTGALVKAACHSGADRSGTSSSKSRGIGFLFSVIGFPHADDAAGAVAQGPGENHHPAPQKPDGDVARLAIIEPGILHRQMIVFEHLGGVGHVQAPLFQGVLPLGGVELDLHVYMLLRKQAASIPVVTFIREAWPPAPSPLHNPQLIPHPSRCRTIKPDISRSAAGG